MTPKVLKPEKPGERLHVTSKSTAAAPISYATMCTAHVFRRQLLIGAPLPYKHCIVSKSPSTPIFSMKLTNSLSFLLFFCHYCLFLPLKCHQMWERNGTPDWTVGSVICPRLSEPITSHRNYPLCSHHLPIRYLESSSLHVTVAHQTMNHSWIRESLFHLCNPQVSDRSQDVTTNFRLKLWPLCRFRVPSKFGFKSQWWHQRL